MGAVSRQVYLALFCETSEPCAQALFVLISGRSWKRRRGSGGRLERNARNPALILGYNKGPGRGGRASASAVREPPARPDVCGLRRMFRRRPPLATRPDIEHARPCRLTAATYPNG